jgi:hypothetical protein
MSEEGRHMKSEFDLARRVRVIRVELYGDDGVPELARVLGLPARTWFNYEQGITIPGETILAFMVATGADPGWLLHGEGPQFRFRSKDGSSGALSVNR